MVLKTFNVEQDTFQQFSHFCKSRGLSMSRQVQFFMKSVVDEDPHAKEEYLKKLDEIRKNKFIEVQDFGQRYGV